MTSLKSRLSLGLAVSLVILLLLQWAVASVVIEHLIEDQLTTRLKQDSESLLAGIRFDTHGRLTLDADRVNTIYQRPLSGHYYAISSGEQRQLSRSLWDNRLSFPQTAAGAESKWHVAGPSGQKLLVMALGYRKQNRDITIAVAEDLTEVEAGLERFQLIYGAVSLGILAILLLTQHFIVSSGLRPLAEIRSSMGRLERGEIDRIETTAPTELTAVIAELNRLLAAMSKRTRRSRTALGNLAHALNTRLAVLQQSTEHPALTSHAQLRAAMMESVEAMRHIVERELKRARLLGDALPGKRVDIAEEITLLVQTLRLMHKTKKPDIRWSIAPSAYFVGDQEDLLELLGNLLDNACKWCRNQVRLDVQLSPQHGLAFIVEDDGPGCAPDQLAALTQRGFRADESRPGSGLGLAIARDIVESYEGTLAFGPSAELGGLRVEVRLPS